MGILITRWLMVMVMMRNNANDDDYGDFLLQLDLSPKNKNKIIHWNDTTSHASPPTIYVCHPNDGNARREIIDIMANVLPEYQIDYYFTTIGPRQVKLEGKYLEGGYTNEYDIFLHEFNLGCSSKVNAWIMTHFNGHIVLFSGESPYQHPIQAYGRTKIHAFGPIDYEREGDVTLTYLQMTWWKLFQNDLSPETMVNSELRPVGTQENFMIYANGNCVPYREKAVGRLSEIGVVHADGKCQGSTPPDGNRTNLVKTNNKKSLRNWWTNTDLYDKYRFCFVMEHVNQNGYITEKILMAFIAGCIPIYYGSELIFDIFNEKAFVYYNISDPQPALDLVRNLEMNNTLYEEVMDEPIAAHGNETIQKYFSFNDTVGNGFLKKRFREKLQLEHFEP